MKKIVAVLIAIFLLSCFVASTGFSKEINNKKGEITNKRYANQEFYTHEYSQRYAMIVVGEYQTDNHYGWFLKATQKLYNVLTSEDYGFSDDEIFILLNIKNKWDEPDIFDKSIVDYKATEENIQDVLATFKTGGENEIPSDGLLFFTFIDHGNNNFFGLEGDDVISSSELYGYMDNIQGRNIVVLQPCMSGSFVDDLSKPGRIVCASVLPFQVEGGWIESLTRGLDGVTQSDHPNGEVDSRPSDGRISLEEAFFQAASHIHDDAPFGKYSLLDDNGDGKGSGPYFLKGKGYDIDDNTKDGYKASRVFYLTYEEFLLTVKAKKSGEKYTVNFEGIASGGVKPYSWYWDFGDGEESTEQNPIHTYEEDGEYTVTLTVTDGNDDTEQDTISIKTPLSKSKVKEQYQPSFIERIYRKYSVVKKILNYFL